VKHLSKTGVGVRLLALVAFVIVASASPTRAQEPAAEKPPSAGVQSPSPTPGGMQILTSTAGVNFEPYMKQLHDQVNKTWSTSLPDAFSKGARGVATILFDINRDGSIGNLSLERSSGNDSLDQAAINAIRNSGPFAPLPLTFKGPHIALRTAFQYNLTSLRPDCSGSTTGAPQAPPFDRLELLAFLAGQGRALYEMQAICQRGIDFTPDSSFLAALGLYGVSPDAVDAVKTFKPRGAGKPSPDRVSAYGLLDVALTDKHNKQLASANEDFVRALQLAPDSATLHLAYAKNLLLLKNYPEAEVQARQSLKLWPEDSEAYVALAMALTLQKRDSEAIPEAREALRIFPSNKAALAELGISQARSGQFKEAIPALQEAIPLAPELPIIHKLLGASLVRTGDFDAAVVQLTLFLKAMPNDAEAHYFLGVALRANGKRDEALAELREAKRIEPSNPLYLAVVDPADSKETAKASSKPAGPQPDDCFFSDNVYTNTFFGFSYEFPKGWIVLKASTGEAVSRLGVSILANGDPTMPDIAEAVARNAYQLLFVTKQTTKDISTNVSSILIQAMDKRVLEPGSKSGEELLKSIATMLTSRGLAITVAGPPEQFNVAERTFWSLRLNSTINGSTSHVVEAVTMEKDYLLVFVFASPDESKLDELVHTMQSLRFTDSSAPNYKP
jgi:TonB family protein